MQGIKFIENLKIFLSPPWSLFVFFKSYHTTNNMLVDENNSNAHVKWYLLLNFFVENFVGKIKFSQAKYKFMESTLFQNNLLRLS